MHSLLLFRPTTLSTLVLNLVVALTVLTFSSAEDICVDDDACSLHLIQQRAERKRRRQTEPSCYLSESLFGETFGFATGKSQQEAQAMCDAQPQCLGLLEEKANQWHWVSKGSRHFVRCCDDGCRATFKLNKEYCKTKIFKKSTCRSTTATTTELALAAVEEGRCTIFDDVIGFDKQNALLSFHLRTPESSVTQRSRPGDVWLVRSPFVRIQGRYNAVDGGERTFLRALAVGGPFLQNNTLLVGWRNAKVFWNDEKILTSVPSQYNNGIISARYDSDSMLVQDSIQKVPGINIEFPLAVKLLVNRGKNGLNVQISMPKLQGGQDGQCGNYNGISEDDTAELVAARIGNAIHPNELLFKHPFDGAA